MADYASATILIGGTLAPADIPTLIALIEQADVWTDWEETPFVPEDLLRGETLLLRTDQTAWGAFEQIESFCRDHGLPYARWSGGCRGSFGPQRVVFDGINAPWTFTATEDDEIVISLDAVRILASIEAIEDHFKTADFTVPPLRIAEGAPSDGGKHG